MSSSPSDTEQPTDGQRIKQNNLGNIICIPFFVCQKLNNLLSAGSLDIFCDITEHHRTTILLCSYIHTHVIQYTTYLHNACIYVGISTLGTPRGIDSKSFVSLCMLCPKCMFGRPF